MAVNSDKFFNYNGTRYYMGTVFECYDFLSSNPKENIVKFKFLNTMGNGSKCRIQRQGENCNNICDLKEFINNIISVADNPGKAIFDKQNGTYKNDKYFYHYTEDGDDFYTYKDDSYYVGLILYILIMLFLSITNGAIVGWIVATIIFLIWRNKKLKGK